MTEIHGFPVRFAWRESVKIADLLNQDDPPFDGPDFDTLRDTLVARLREVKITDDELRGLVDDLAESSNADEFDAVLPEIYDWADEHRLWLDPFERTSDDAR